MTLYAFDGGEVERLRRLLAAFESGTLNQRPRMVPQATSGPLPTWVAITDDDIPAMDPSAKTPSSGSATVYTIVDGVLTLTQTDVGFDVWNLWPFDVVAGTPVLLSREPLSGELFIIASCCTASSISSSSASSTSSGSSSLVSSLSSDSCAGSIASCVRLYTLPSSTSSSSASSMSSSSSSSSLDCCLVITNVLVNVPTGTLLCCGSDVGGIHSLNAAGSCCWSAQIPGACGGMDAFWSACLLSDGTMLVSLKQIDDVNPANTADAPNDFVWRTANPIPTNCHAMALPAYLQGMAQDPRGLCFNPPQTITVST